VQGRSGRHDLRVLAGKRHGCGIRAEGLATFFGAEMGPLARLDSKAEPECLLVVRCAAWGARLGRLGPARAGPLIWSSEC